MNSATIKIKHISRVAHAKCWSVRILRTGRKGSKLDLSHSFADRKYGSHDKALTEAMLWRDRMLGLLSQ